MKASLLVPRACSFACRAQFVATPHFRCTAPSRLAADIFFCVFSGPVMPKGATLLYRTRVTLSAGWAETPLQMRFPRYKQTFTLSKKGGSQSGSMPWGG